MVRLGEWETGFERDVTLTPGDRRLAESLRRDRLLEIDELRDGVRVKTRAWVGVVRFDSFELVVEPKLAASNLGLVGMLEFTTGLDALRRLSPERQLEAAGSDLLNLFGLLLVEETERILRGGLLTDYVEREDEQPVLRGRLLVDRQVRERYAQLDRLVCRYDEHEQDVVENQLLAAALGRCGALLSHEQTRRRARQLHGILREVCDPDALDLSEARTSITYDRLNERYRGAHQLAWIILDALGLKDVLAGGAVRSFAFMFDMNLLFERFVFEYLHVLLGSAWTHVEYQRRDRSIVWHETRNRSYATVIPDVLIARGSGAELNRLPVDAKYKRYTDRKADPGDVYQVFMYSYAYGDTREGRHGFLVYPSETGEFIEDVLSIRDAEGLSGARIHLVGVPVARALAEIPGGEGPVSDALRAVAVAASQPVASVPG
jgi:5-methylcytosine-specific restriction enzyme subunit McrC